MKAASNPPVIGEQFGYLTVLKFAYVDHLHRRVYLCRCHCKKTVLRAGSNMRRVPADTLQSCGCARKEWGEKISEAKQNHGMANRGKKHPAYLTWVGMRQRCYNPRVPSYLQYGARGIKVCKRWLESFENFWADMGPTWEKGLTLDRKNNNGNYTPKNCRWATAREQVMNRSNTMQVDLAAVARSTGLSYFTVYHRYRRGLRGETLITKPVHLPKNLTALAAEHGLAYNTLRLRYHQGLRGEDLTRKERNQ